MVWLGLVRTGFDASLYMLGVVGTGVGKAWVW